MGNRYENTYKNKNHFSFGKNWQNFLKTLNNSKIEEAKESLINFLGGIEKIKGKTFIDIGCGSGLFSLAALNLGASSVVSVDIDDFSLACVEYLKKRNNDLGNWEIKKGSALDKKFIDSLGKFDVVYSWGVLHHTGEMRKAFENVINLMNPASVFYLAIYNKNTEYRLEGTSEFWLRVKRIYNESNSALKKTIEVFYISYFMLGLLVSLKNPIHYIKHYSTLRGMDFFTDIRDWLGGYPYEFATTEEIIDYFKNHNVCCEKYKEVRSIGCNEYLLLKENL